MIKSEFIKTVTKHAQADYSKSKVLPSLTIAQAILESAWGESGLTKKGNALFGIKATKSWKGKTINSKTFEYYDGNRCDIVDCFRAYDSWEHSIQDHGAFLQLARYKAVLGETDYHKACKAIQQAGYATAPTYADTLISIIEQNNLSQYDKADEPKAIRYKVVIYSFQNKEDADKVKQALVLLGCYAETYAIGDGFYKVESYAYKSVDRAKEVQEGLRLLAGCYSEIREM